MAEHPKPLSKNEAPDPARVYERAKPEAESPAGGLEAHKKTPPPNKPDMMKKAVSHRQKPRQINAEDDGEAPTKKS